MKYVCELCGWIYDEATGDPKCGVAADTAFSVLPAEYECPCCGSEKEAFSMVEVQTRASATRSDDRGFWQSIKYADERGDSLR